MQCEQQGPAKVFDETETDRSRGGFESRAGRVACGFRKHYWVSSLLRAKVRDPTQGLHGLLGKAGGKLLSTVSVGPDDFLNRSPF